VTAITHKNGTGGTLSYYNYSYDNADRVSSQSWSIQVGTTTYQGTPSYTYDPTNQLLTDSVNTFTYDLSGNRTMTGCVTATGNRLTTDGVWTFTYDSEGNLVSKQSRTTAETVSYTYDTANHLISVLDRGDGTNLSATVTYQYDVEGKRVRQDKWVKPPTGAGVVTTTLFAYDRDNVAADFDGNGTLLARYQYGDGPDQILTRTIAGGQNPAWAYLTDRMGSVRDLMDWNGVVQDHLEYDGFGNVTSESNTAFGDRYGFTGRERDRDSAFQDKVSQYNRARYYDTKTGRWTSEDPSLFAPGDANLYRYVGNGPTNGVDPNGLGPTGGTYRGEIPSGPLPPLTLYTYGAPGGGPLNPPAMPFTIFRGAGGRLDLPFTRIMVLEVKAPLKKDWGAFAWPVIFKLDTKADAENGGLILQHVHSTILDTVTKKLFDEKDYWEAWWVKPGKRGVPPIEASEEAQQAFKAATTIDLKGIKANDWYINTGFPNTSGKITIKGEVYFLDKAGIWDLPDDWTRDFAPAGGLWAVDTKGAGGAAEAKRQEVKDLLKTFKAVGPVLHDITVSWTKEDKKTKVEAKKP
jgi:RHS repeat-associated protein